MPPPTIEKTVPANTVATNTVARDQVTNPCAVSRKKTSCVWVPTHLVRSLPAIYPPSAAESHWVTISQIAAVTVNVVAEAPCPGQGEIEANPRPDPRASRTSETDTATTAPAKMAGQDAADFPAKRASSTRISPGRASPVITCSIRILLRDASSDASTSPIAG